MAFITIPVIPCSKNLTYMPEKMYSPWERYVFTFDLSEGDYALSLDLVDATLKRFPGLFLMTVTYAEGESSRVESFVWSEFKEVGTDTPYSDIPTPKNARIYKTFHGKIIGLQLDFSDVTSGHVEKVMFERGSIPTEWEQAEE